MGLIPWRNKSSTEMKQSDIVPSVANLRREMDNLFDRFFHSPWSLMDWEGPSWFASSSWLPSLDVNETDKEVSLNVELPGVDPKDVEITLSGKTLTIRGEKKEEVEDKNKNYYRVERRFGSFARSIELPHSVDDNSISADYRNGVLSIKAKKTADAQAKRISIESH